MTATITMDTHITSPPLARRRVARTLRTMREQAGMYLKDAAPRLDLSRSGLNRLEIGKTLADVHVARSMMDLYDCYSPTLLDTIRVSRTRGWWCKFGITDDYVGWEADAGRICEFATTRIPDLLQTEGYARALHSDIPDLALALSALKIRQRRLDTALQLSVVLSETALDHHVDSAAVMHAQLAHLAERAILPNVSLQILPAAAAARTQPGSFRLLDFRHPDDPPIVFADSALGQRKSDDEQTITQIRRLFRNVNAAALDHETTRSFIQQKLGH